MNFILTTLNLLVALLFVFIFYLETLATQSNRTAKVFNMTKEDLDNKSIQNLFKNQGVYNLLLGIGLVYATFFSGQPLELSRFLHFYIVGVAAYGAISVDPKILLKQGALSILFILLSFFL